MLEQQQIARSSKHSPKSCKGHQEIPKLIAAAWNTCLKTEYNKEKRRANMTPDLKSISRHQRDDTIAILVCALGRGVENTNGISECMGICNMLEG